MNTSILNELTTDFNQFNLVLTISENIKYKFIAKCVRLSNKAKFGYKSIFNYGFNCEQRLIKFLADYLETQAKQTEQKKQASLIKKELNDNIKASDFYKIGDIVVNSWGLEQTNIDFYKVTEVKGKTIKIVEICSVIEKGSMYSHGMACNVLPDVESIKEGGKEYNLRVKTAEWCKGSHFLSNPASYYYMHKWDGKPLYRSWYA